MKPFFHVQSIESVLGMADSFSPIGPEEIPLTESLGRILFENITAEENLPGFARSTMDGFAVSAASTFGASEGSPAFLEIVGQIAMGDHPNFSLRQGEAAAIATGGMLPEGADAVVMVEHTESVDDDAIEVYRSLAPGQHIITAGEDVQTGELLLPAGRRIRPQEAGLLAALGRQHLQVFRKPRVGILSTGDEIVPIREIPPPGKIRDVNAYSLHAQVQESGGIPVVFGMVGDDNDLLVQKCKEGLQQCDMLLISGGSSVGTRDFTVSAMASLPDAEVLFHGISISPGKPTLLARISNKPVWGLPGHVVSAMVVFRIIVRHYLEHIAGLAPHGRTNRTIPARMKRNVASAQGRTDFLRVRLTEKDGEYWAEPILGKSGLISTMVHADGLVEIPENTEGLDKEMEIRVILL
jgi:molybdopterin molybdotransferase